MARIIVERSFDPPLTQATMEAMGQRVGRCLELYGVSWLGSHVSLDRKRMVCVFEAADAQSVRDMQNTAQAPFDRVWPADILAPD
jgi:hypothetical protein